MMGGHISLEATSATQPRILRRNSVIVSNDGGERDDEKGMIVDGSWKVLIDFVDFDEIFVEGVMKDERVGGLGF